MELNLEKINLPKLTEQEKHYTPPNHRQIEKYLILCKVQIDQALDDLEKYGAISRLDHDIPIAMAEMLYEDDLEGILTTQLPVNKPVGFLSNMIRKENK